MSADLSCQTSNRPRRATGETQRLMVIPTFSPTNRLSKKFSRKKNHVKSAGHFQTACFSSAIKFCLLCLLDKSFSRNLVPLIPAVNLYSGFTQHMNCQNLTDTIVTTYTFLLLIVFCFKKYFMLLILHKNKAGQVNNHVVGLRDVDT